LRAVCLRRVFKQTFDHIAFEYLDSRRQLDILACASCTGQGRESDCHHPPLGGVFDRQDRCVLVSAKSGVEKTQQFSGKMVGATGIEPVTPPV
jgi:hypothetical protein